MNPYQMLSLSNTTLFYAEQALRHVPMVILQVIFLSLWVALFVYIKRLFKSRKRKLIVMLGCLLFLAGILIAFKHAMQKRVYLKIVNPRSAVYSGPADTFTMLDHLQTGEELIKLQSIDCFYKVRWHRAIGWINKKDAAESTLNKSEAP